MDRAGGPPGRKKPYEQVELTPLGPDSSSADGAKGSKRQEWLDYVWRKLMALLWIVIAVAIAMFIKLQDVIVASYTPGNTGRQLNTFWFNVGLAGFGGWCLLAVYLVIYLKYIKRIEVEWEEYSPRAIPTATVCAVASLLGFVLALWPAWGFLTLPIVWFLFLGALNLAHFIPL